MNAKAKTEQMLVSLELFLVAESPQWIRISPDLLCEDMFCAKKVSSSEIIQENELKCLLLYPEVLL